MITREECERRDAVLRAWLAGKDWDLDAEQRLRRALVVGSGEWLAGYPYLVGVEWTAPNGSRGDLLFFDGVARFAVVEVKALGKREPTKRRGEVEMQARTFARGARLLYPRAEVEPLVYTDDEAERGVGPRHPDRRWVDGADVITAR